MKRLSIVPLIISLVVALDQFTKHLASNSIEPYDTVTVLPVLNFVNLKNVGAAFGMGSSIGNTVFIAVTVLVIGFIIYIMVKEKEGVIPLTLILSGATGNLIDRIVFGYVRDFIDFHIGDYHWFAFNVADSSLTIGAILLVAVLLIPRKSPDKPQ